jgi:hypothetical protein
MSFTKVIRPRGRTPANTVSKPPADARPKAARPILHLKPAADL